MRPGIDVFLEHLPADLRGKRVGLITNHSAIDRAGVSDIDLIARHGDLRLVALLAPEHGIRGEADAGANDRRRGRREDRHPGLLALHAPRIAARRRRC